MLITALAFSSVHSIAAPADQDFNAIAAGTLSAPNGSLTFSGVTYSTDATDDQMAVDTIANITGGYTSLGTGNGLSSVWLGLNVGTYLQFAATNNADNFKIVSFNAEVWGHNSANSEIYTVKGYDNGVEQASATINFRTGGNFGSGSSALTCTRLTTASETSSSGDGANCGMLTFTGSGWGNIDRVRIIVADTAPNIILGVSVDNIVFADPNQGSANISPAFVGVMTTFTVNQNAAATDVKPLLHASDIDSSQTLTWSEKTAPTHGTLLFSSATAASGSTDITPGGSITYTPANGYAGSDSFAVQVSDGTTNATRTISVNVADNIAPSIISIVRQSPTNQVVSGSNVTFRVTFSETVTGVDASDFVVSTSGSADGSIGSLAMISGAVYDVGITNMRAAGSLRLDLRGSGTGVQDGPGNSISSGYTNGQSYLLPIDLAGPNTQWKAVRFAGTNQFDYPSDTQAGAADLDLVGNLIHPVLYTQYYDAGTAGSVSDDTIGFRARIGNPSSQTDLGSVLLVGIDGNTDGRIDLFVSADGRNNGRQVRIWSPGSAANNSPATTSITAPTNQKSYAFNVSNFVALSVSSVSDPAAGSSLNADLNADSRNDILASFNLPFADVQSEMLRISGVTIGPDTALRYVLITLTQNNSINGDIAGINGGTSSSATYESLGLFSDTISANNTPPAISSIANQNTTTGVPTGPVAFTLSDEESDAAALTVTAMSSNLTLLPVANITLAGSGASRTVTLAPAAGQSGSAVVTLTVSDGVLVTSTRFSLIVTGANSTPTDISLSSSTVGQSSGTNATVGTLSTTDANSGDTFTYTLVSGAGSTDNASFNLSGATLRANNAATMAAGAYSIRLRTTDSASAAYEEVFTITAADNIAPQVVSVVRKTPSLQTVITGPVVFAVTFSENVLNVSASSFAVTPVGSSTVTGAISSISGGPQIYDVTVNVTSGTGEFRLDAIGSLIF